MRVKLLQMLTVSKARTSTNDCGQLLAGFLALSIDHVIITVSATRLRVSSMAGSCGLGWAMN